MTEIDAYDYYLPPEAIAQTPLEDRAASRLLWLHRADGGIEHRRFRDVPELLRPGDLLVLNDTRVSALRLYGRKPTGGAVEVLLMSQMPGERTFSALVRPARTLRPGTRIAFEEGLAATVLGRGERGSAVLAFDPVEGFSERLTAAGLAPTPPYVKTPLRDLSRYQTVYARHPGSAAAPTAGLHFTTELFEELARRGVERAFVTLDVGLDTFRPIASERLDEHEMHGERCSVPPETVEKVEACSGRIVAVGTTTVRTLETFAVGPRRLRAGTEVSRLFIKPGYELRICDGLFTNFHMPRTTMLLMLAAFVGRDPLMRAYEEALREGYRFLSFGDAMLIL